MADKKSNLMYQIEIEKIVLSVGGIGDDLEKGFKLLKILTEKTPTKTKAKKRIPTFGIRPGLEIGAMVTLRKDKEAFLEKMFVTIDKVLKKKQVSQDNFSFGIKEYIEIPGMEYQRDIGIMGFNVTVVFKRKGHRVMERKMRKGKIPKRQHISSEEIIKFLEDKFGVTFD